MSAPATETDVRMMRRALGLAREAASVGEAPVGALVYVTETEEIIGEGLNDRERAHDPAGHAEFHAIRAAAKHLGDFRLEGCTLVVTLEPCPMCAGLIVNARVDRLVFGATDPKAGACGSVLDVTQDERLNHRVTPIAGVLADESSELLRSFFRSLRAK